MALPLLDEQSAVLDVSRPVAWRAVRRCAVAMASADHGVIGRILGTRPRSGFELTEEVEPERLVLAGHHRFARYGIVVRLEEQPGAATRVTIRSLAAFPGARGRAYRTLLLATGGHVLAVRHMLRSIRRDIGP